VSRRKAVKPAPVVTGNGLRGADSSGKEDTHAHSEILSKPQPSWRDVLPIHPAADLFPLLGKAELRELADDIKKNGLREPVQTYIDRGTHILLDGRNRLDALELNGEIIFDGSNAENNRWPKGSNRKFFESDASIASAAIRNPSDCLAYVISKNIHRRHLTRDQKRECIAKILKANAEESNRRIAELSKADDKTVAKVRAELEATAEIPQLKKTKGKDGKERPTRKKVSAGGSEKPTHALIDSRPALDMGVKSESEKALAEFKYACDHWFLKMTKTQHEEAIKYVTEWAEKRIESIANAVTP
jgi:hypothetical protein